MNEQNEKLVISLKNDDDKDHEQTEQAHLQLVFRILKNIQIVIRILHQTQTHHAFVKLLDSNDPHQERI